MRSVQILLIDDDDDHVKILQRTLGQMQGHVERVKDGIEAIASLKKKCDDSIPLPDFILLDLNLPKKSGFEVLEEIKSDPRLQGVPVIILSTSNAKSDKIKAYEKRANSYLVKPMDVDSFKKMAEGLNLYWGFWNKTPYEPETIEKSDHEPTE